jgi:acid phosphatase type 7
MQNPGISRRRFLQATMAASAGSALLAQQPPSAPVFARYPNIQNLSANGGSIVWALTTLVSGVVVVVDPSGNGITVPASVAEFTPAVTGMPQTYYQYVATFGGLKPGTIYTYQVQAEGQIVTSALTRPLEFATPGAGAFSFINFADSGEGNNDQLALRLQMVQESVSFAIANGDLAYELATYASIEANYYGVYQEMMTQIPFFASLGNHEYLTQNALPTLASRVTPTAGVPQSDWGRYYSFDWGNAHFVALDSNAPLDAAVAGTGPMLAWLANDLQNTTKFWKIVFFHHPGFATGTHQNEPPAGEVRQGIVPILEQYGVQLVFNGHEHTYQRTYELLAGQVVAPNSGGVVYVTSGGGGADPYYTAPNALISQSIGVNNYVHAEVSGEEITLKVRGLGQRGDIDSIVLAPQPQMFSAVNSASLTTDLASGGALTVTGRNLSATAFQSGLRAQHLTENGCSATLNGMPIPILSAGAAQMNLQIPFTFSGTATLTVLTRNGMAHTTIQVAPVAPQFFMSADGSVMATHADGSQVSFSSPARTSETITLFLTGLGAVNGTVQAGILPPAGVAAVAPVQITIGNVVIPSLRGVLSVTSPGTYQVQVQVPSGLRGSAAVQATANSVVSNTPILWIASV